MKQIVENFKPSGGKHCISHAIKQVFDCYEYRMSEEMIFGLASGLSFMYINLSHAPMISGRTNIFAFEETLAKRLGIDIFCRKSKKYNNAFVKCKKMIDQGQPVLVYVDMPFLKYLGLNDNNHFGGHAVVIFGYDDEKQVFYVSDRDHHDAPIRSPQGRLQSDYHLVSYEEMKNARSSNYKPFPANNKYLAFDLKDNKPRISKTMLYNAIQETCEAMLYPETKMLGLSGIEKFSKEILKWKNFTPEKRKQAGVTNYFQISKDGGTGGGLFRNMYGLFLMEAANFIDNPEWQEIGKEYITLSKRWDDIAQQMWRLFEKGDVSLLQEMSDSIDENMRIEKGLLLRLEKS